jgi:Cu(I)-responsive transcriptional regulator
MNIGTAAQRSGVPAKTIRYYETIGLIPSAARTSAGYRDYDDDDVETLGFVQRARSLGFTVKEVAALLELWRDRDRASGDVRALAERHIAEIDGKIAELRHMRQGLADLVERCAGDRNPHCAILDGLARPGSPS